MNLMYVLLLIIAVRLASVFIVQTYYVPDEYWQSLEVAHKLAFGYGHLTWEWVHGIRSYLYPSIIAGVYKLLALLNLDSAKLLIIVPRLLQAALSAYSDYRFFVWTGKKKWALFLVLASWWWFYTGSRTLANTLEASLTTIALSYFPWRGESNNYLWPVALCCFVRPTAVVVWAPLCVYHLRKTNLPITELLLKRFLPIGLVVGALCTAVDTYFHGSFIVTPYEFLKVNIFQNIGTFYGSNSWHWYATVGLPTVLGINTLPFIFGIIETVQHSASLPVHKNALISVATAMVLLSVMGHKEFRFLSSLLPLCFYVTSDRLTRWSYRASRKMLWATAFLILIGNSIPAWYLSTVHQRGPVAVMSRLQEIARDYRGENSHRASILFLMPCHSTPFFSHVHENVTMRFLTCEPNLLDKPEYKDEADQFYDSPMHWLNSHIPSYPCTAKPSHLVMFNGLENQVHEFLSVYRVLERISHTEVNANVLPQRLLDEWSILVRKWQYLIPESLLQRVYKRTGKDIIVWERVCAREVNAFNRDERESENDKRGYVLEHAADGDYYDRE